MQSLHHLRKLGRLKHGDVMTESFSCVPSVKRIAEKLNKCHPQCNPPLGFFGVIATGEVGFPLLGDHTSSYAASLAAGLNELNKVFRWRFHSMISSTLMCFERTK